MRFIKSAITSLIFKAIAMTAGLAVSIVIARVLGPEGRGVYALVMTIIVLSASFGVFGLTAANTFFAANNVKMSRTIGTQSIVAGLAGAVLSIAVIYLIDTVNPIIFRGLNDVTLALTFAMIPLFLWGNLFAFAYLGRGKILPFNAFETGQRVIFFIMSLLFLWYWQESFETFLLAVLVTVGFLVLIYAINYFRDVSPGPHYESGYTATSFAYGIKSYAATLLTLAVMRTGVLFTNYFGGNEAAGFFAVAQQISELVIIIPTVVGTVLFGRVSKGDSYYLTPMVLRTITVIFLPVTVLLFFVSEQLVISIFGAEFASSVAPLKLMLPGAFLLGLEVIMAKDIAGRGYPWPAVLAWIPVLIINVIGFAVLIPKYGVNGAAIAVSISFMTIFILITSYYVRLSKTSLSQLFLIKKEDVRTLFDELQTLVSGDSISNEKGRPSENRTVSDQTKTEMQNMGR